MNARAHRANVSIVFADEDSQFRTGLRNVLVGEGYTDIRDCASLEKVTEAFRSETPDLLVIDGRMERGRALDLISEIRGGTLGINPFVVVIVTLWEPDGELVRHVIQRAVDDLLLKPVSTAQLLDRIAKLAGERQRFVVTKDYIGPQRRKQRLVDDNPEGLKLDLIAVPNTLGAKSRGEKVDPAALRKLIADAQVEINEQRLKRNAPEIAALVREIVPAYQENRVDGRIEARVESLAAFAEDVSERVADTRYRHVSDLCRVLGSISGSLRGGKASPKSIALLKPLSDAIGASFNPEDASADFAEQVVEMVRQHIAKSTVPDTPAA